MRFKTTRILFVLTVFQLLIFPSCTSRKKLVYFQGDGTISADNISYVPVFHIDDLLSISVTGIDPESAKPFNSASNSFNNNQGGYTNGNPGPPGYLIDTDGMVDLPVIGKMKLAGMDRMKATELLKEKLNQYVKSPSVNIRILNYKVTVLGEVRNPGTFTIPNERITLPEALGIAGDISITGLRKNVLVIRDVDGKRTETRIDMTSKDVFSSPVYYLHQNDLVYVEPNRARINSSVVNASNVGIVISVLSLLTTMAVLLSR